MKERIYKPNIDNKGQRLKELKKFKKSNKPILLIDESYWDRNKIGIAHQMLYEFNEIDFYIAEPYFLGYRYWHITGELK